MQRPLPPSQRTSHAEARLTSAATLPPGLNSDVGVEGWAYYVFENGHQHFEVEEMAERRSVIVGGERFAAGCAALQITPISSLLGDGVEEF